MTRTVHEFVNPVTFCEQGLFLCEVNSKHRDYYYPYVNIPFVPSYLHSCMYILSGSSVDLYIIELGIFRSPCTVALKYDICCHLKFKAYEIFWLKDINSIKLLETLYNLLYWFHARCWRNNSITTMGKQSVSFGISTIFFSVWININHCYHTYN